MDPPFINVKRKVRIYPRIINGKEDWGVCVISEDLGREVSG